MRVKHCLAPNCSSNTENEPGLTFHSLPSNDQLLHKWAKNMDREEKIFSAPKSTQKHYFICGKHFLDSCFQTYERKKLNRGAIPTIFDLTKEKKSVPNLKITSIFKRECTTKPIILNHQIVFPNVFENIEDAAQPMLPQLNQTSVEIDLVQDGADPDAIAKTKINVELPELTPVHYKSDGINTSICKVKNEPAEAVTPVESANQNVSSVREDSVEKLLCDMFEDIQETPKSPVTKFKNGREKIAIKPSKKHIRRLLIKAKKIILLLQKCNGSCMKLFNKRVTIFNSKVIENLEKLDQMPALIRTYMNYQTKKFSKTKSVKYKKHEIPFYAALYKSNRLAYQFLSKIFNLPSLHRLEIFLKNTNFDSGINELLLDYLKAKSKIRNPLDKYCTLLFKEVRLCPYLCYNSETDTTEGLQVNNGYERTCNIVNQCFIFFLSGLHKAWKQPIAYYFVSNLTKSLHNCITEVISEIHEKTDFRIVASVSAMNTVNINAIQYLMKMDSNDYVYEVNDREIIHIFDPPNLLIQLRNHFINRDIIYNENRVAKWELLVELSNLDGRDGAVKLTKLTRDHVNPGKDQKRKIALAAQLFSGTVSSCLRISTRLAASDNEDTAAFCFFVNNLFDSFNGTLVPKYKANKLTGKLSDSSSHFEFWSEAATTLSSLKFVDNKTGKTYSSYVAQAFLINIKNMKKLWNQLKKEGFKYLITKHLNLDPLENFHAVMRYFYRKNSKCPTSQQFQESFKISLLNDTFRNPNSNCEADATVYICPLKPDVFYSDNCLSPLSNTRYFSSAMYKMVGAIRLYSAEHIAKFLANNVLNYKCDVCVKVFCKDNAHMIAVDKLISQIKLVQREVYKNITEYLNQDQFVKMLYCFAEQKWSFDFVCPKHKYEMKYKTIVSICFIMVKCFIEITNKMLWKQLTRK